jgi:hypothetical protein
LNEPHKAIEAYERAIAIAPQRDAARVKRDRLIQRLRSAP